MKMENGKPPFFLIGIDKPISQLLPPKNTENQELNVLLTIKTPWFAESLVNKASVI